MMELLRSWVMGITGAAMISAVCIAITPEGRVKKVVRLACGLLTILCLAMPLTKGSINFADKLASVRAGTDNFLEDVEETEQVVTRAVIQEKYEAYISDKGNSLGVQVSDVSVDMRWNTDGYWYPVGTEIASDTDENGKTALEKSITADLGISAEDIYWR